MKNSTRPIVLAGIAWLAAIVPSGAYQLTVTISAQNFNSPLGFADGTDLAAGSLVRFGYFNLSPSQVDSNFHNLSLLNSSFTVLAECEISFFDGLTTLDNAGQITSYDAGTLVDGVDGLFGHDVSLDAEAMSLLTTRPYIWVLNASGIDTATQHAIFSNDGWAFASFGTLSFDIADVSSSDPNDVYLATYGPEMASSGMGILNKLQPLPEPQSALMLLMGIALMVLRRQRRHR